MASYTLVGEPYGYQVVGQRIHSGGLRVHPSRVDNSGE